MKNRLLLTEGSFFKLWRSFWAWQEIHDGWNGERVKKRKKEASWLVNVCAVALAHTCAPVSGVGEQKVLHATPQLSLSLLHQVQPFECSRWQSSSLVGERKSGEKHRVSSKIIVNCITNLHRVQFSSSGKFVYDWKVERVCIHCRQKPGAWCAFCFNVNMQNSPQKTLLKIKGGVSDAI